MFLRLLVIVSCSILYIRGGLAQGLLTPLTDAPDWRSLDVYQQLLSRSEFEEVLTNRFSADGAFLNYCEMNNNSLMLYDDQSKHHLLWILNFRSSNFLPLTNHLYFFKKRSQYDSPQPLKELIIALDPGHIGGEWAKMEERFFQIGNDAPILEWNLNYLVCQIIAEKLTNLGAEIVWVKSHPDPVTSLRPSDLWDDALHGIFNERGGIPASWPFDPHLSRMRIHRRSELIFYRNAEIRARAHKLNQELQPDLTLCVHFNAVDWGDPLKPTLVQDNKLVIFTHGGYLATELVYEDQKYHLMRKLLEGAYHIEEEIAVKIAERYQKIWGWPPVPYKNNPGVVSSQKSPYVYARNLLANRLFNGPTVFVEGPYMNSKEIYPRLLAGDYEETQKINGKQYRSIFREYAQAVVEGILDYFQKP